MFRIRPRYLPIALALAASCASPPATVPDPAPPADPGSPTAQPTGEQAAVALGVTIAARDDRGAPRLVRAIVPRHTAARMSPDQAARDHLTALTPLYMTRQRPSELATHSVQTFRGGAQIVRLQQQIDQVDIHAGELRVMVYPDGSLAAVSGTMQPNTGRATFQSTAAAALDRALDAVYGPARVRPAITATDATAGYQALTLAPAPELGVTYARAKRELLPEGDRLVPIWTLELFAEKPNPDGTTESLARRYLIGDADGRVLRDIDLIKNDAFVYRAFADTTGNRNPLDGPLESFTPHPTGVPDGSVAGRVDSNLVVIDSFNGPRDPWLPANATTTSGNNVEAYADINLPLGFSPGDIRPEVRAGRTLNYRYDFNLGPLANETQSKAAAVNVFFVTNWLHDWYYDSGFTEAVGNAQVDNYGRGGVAGDPLVAHAQANARGGSRNNANMATPADGLSPVMNMFLWTSINGEVEHDGDFDNGIVAHEWGHYMHLRLASCEITLQCAAMSEGWGDFVAIHMMMRETDNREGTFAGSGYALAGGGLTPFGFADPGYFGIRRYPYSRNTAKNPLRLRHIGEDNSLPGDVPVSIGPVFNGNSEPHNAGEVWAQMLFEVYNVLLDEHPFAEARRRMSDYVVAGLLLTPPEATYTEARDAILAAAGAIDTDDMILMAAAFAGRGAGTCAVAPPVTSFDLTGVVESGTIAARLATSGVTITDDGVSCDHDGILDPGETGTLRVTIANSGTIAAEDIVITPTTTSPGVTFGAPLNVGSIAALSQAVIEIPVKLAATAAPNGNLDVSIQVASSAGCNTNRLTVALHEHTGIDEVPAAATTDTFETKLQAWTRTGTFADQLWVRADDGTGNHVAFGIDSTVVTDVQLVSPVLQASPTAPLVVTVNHAFNMESDGFSFFDGGVVEVSNDGGATWRDVSQVGVVIRYSGPIATLSPNPLTGRRAFSGVSPGFPARQPLVLNFGTQFAGQAVQIRFRIGTDSCCTAQGWSLDDISVTGTTNTPFPGIVPEPTRCTARSTVSEQPRVAEIHSMPRASLDGTALPFGIADGVAVATEDSK